MYPQVYVQVVETCGTSLEAASQTRYWYAHVEEKGACVPPVFWSGSGPNMIEGVGSDGIRPIKCVRV